MTATSLLESWVLAAMGLVVLLVFLGTGYRLYHNRRPLHYKKLTRINRILIPVRIGFVLLGLAAAVRVATRTSDYHMWLIAPSVWAMVVLFGIIGTDQFLFGFSRYSSDDKPKVRISHCLPWTLIILLLLLLAILWSSADWARGQANSLDQRTHVYSWVLDGVFGWGIKSPFPGTYYTIPLLYCLPAVLVVAVVGIALVLTRRAWLPAEKYAALDEGFRKRTIRDIVLTCVAAVSPTLAMMGFDVAWAFSTLGPGSNQRAAAVAVAFFIGAWNLGQTIWVLANMVFLPQVTQDDRMAEQIHAEARMKVESVSIPGVGITPEVEIELPHPAVESVPAEVEEVPEETPEEVPEEVAETEEAAETTAQESVTIENEDETTVIELVPTVEPIKHFTVKPSATHRPGFKPKKKKTRRR